MQGRAWGNRGGGYHYRSHGFQPYAAASGWQAHGGGGYDHHMQYGSGGGGGGGVGGYGPAYAHRGAPLGVQGAGILKRPTGSPQGPLLHGRGHHYRGERGGGRGGRGGRGRGRGGRDKDKGQKPLTKEALDADLDEWRMKDKKHGGTSLDTELDDYWKDNKEDDLTDKDDGELLESAPAAEPDSSKITKPAAKKPTGASPLDSSNGEALEPSTNGF